MQKTIVYIVEKPPVAKELAPHLLLKYPSEIIYIIPTLYIGLYQFNYPRGLKYTDTPFIGTPKWKPRIFEHFPNPVFEIQSNGSSVFKKSSKTPKEILNMADQIIFAADPDSSGVIAFHTLLKECLGEANAVIKRDALLLKSLSFEAIQQTINYPYNTLDEWYIQARNFGLAKRFFDYNFNANSLILFGEILRKLGVNTNNYIMSKYSLQVLYDLLNNPEKNGDYFKKMSIDWVGTGRYEKGQIGSAASRHALIENLLGNGLIETIDGVFHVSTLGQAFLKSLHPDCQDADLPFRINEWMLTWPDSQPKIERYIKTFFGKQKRFADKSS
ncbi:hypothetical protein [Acinetobacter nosocomialis]|uniref:hypothetical protein n=1 Tax=Acinetobacter nosocomialis TaxID=106654 RepID=UPI001F15B417|nr:hypothetical protein [Acinetobacter nosocomialis]MCE7534227.1 hypothetical protein [Acinetobacter nosocomialis]